jgi:hypothetical protein
LCAPIEAIVLEADCGRNARRFIRCFAIRGGNLSFPSLKEAVENLGREQVGNIVTLQYITDRSLLLNH